MIKNVLLTGGSGFLGSHILKGLLRANYNVVVLVRKKSNLHRIESFKDKYKLFCINEDLSNLNDLFSENVIDVIIHTATEYGRDSSMSSILQSNLLFPVKLLEEGIKNNLKLFINSDTFFGKSTFKDSSYLNEYTTSKKYFLDYLLDSKEKFKVVNMRLEHIFGEYDSENKFVTNVLYQLINNKTEIFLTEGLQKRDFIYIDDVVDAYLKVLENSSKLDKFTEFGVGRGNSITVRYFVELLFEITKSNSELKFGALPIREGEIQDSTANLDGLIELGWKSNYDLKSAISKLVDIEKKSK